MRPKARLAITIVLTALCAACAARQAGEPIQPGFNVFSREQDIQLGQEAAEQIRGQVDVVENRQLQDYISQLGQSLAMRPEADEYPYSFTLINDSSINAFALPGGPIFVHSGLMEAADNEAEVAGVLAHEISHVALRHATNQASKANLIQLPAVLAGAAIGDGSLLARLGQLGLGLGVNSILLKYSRDAETQADALGARIMAGAGYDPLEMARFFQKLEEEGGSRAPEFLSSHPNPGNRVRAVEAEVQTLPRRPYQAGTGRFPQMKQMIAQLPPPERPQQQQTAAVAPPAPPAGNFRRLETNALAIDYPNGWQVFGDRSSAVVTIAPREGLVRTASGGTAIGYGAVLSYYYPPAGRLDLRRSTQELTAQLGSINQNLRVNGNPRALRIAGSSALLTPLAGVSPYGGPEANLLLTVARPEGLFYVVFIGPRNQFAQLEGVFNRMLQSLQFSR